MTARVSSALRLQRLGPKTHVFIAACHALHGTAQKCNPKLVERSTSISSGLHDVACMLRVSATLGNGLSDEWRQDASQKPDSVGQKTLPPPKHALKLCLPQGRQASRLWISCRNSRRFVTGVELMAVDLMPNLRSNPQLAKLSIVELKLFVIIGDREYPPKETGRHQ